MPTTPSFYLIVRQPLRPEAVLLAIVLGVGAIYAMIYAVGHAGHTRLGADDLSRSASGASGSPSAKDDDDDPNQIDTIVLGDPNDAPRPAHRGDHVSPVHPTILIKLPRSGDKVGMIPASPAGQLLYDWLAAFNHASASGLATALPSLGGTAAAQMELRRQTGGFNLVSAKEVEPGVLVFRLRDQSPAGVEVLGTLQVRQGAIPASVGSFSLRDVPAVVADTPHDAGASPR